jgi:hypothetical protein
MRLYKQIGKNMRKKVIVGSIITIAVITAIILLVTSLHVVPAYADPDHDGLTNDREEMYGTNPNNPDTDNDGLKDGEEIDNYGTSPVDYDTDVDGIGDGDEVLTYGTNPKDLDSDDDGLEDGYEVMSTHTNPTKLDTDGDGLNDKQEIDIYHTNALNPDPDYDGLNDYQEVITRGTNPWDNDSDDDGLTDGTEVNEIGTNPLDSDTDDDGYLDGIDFYPFYDAYLFISVDYFEEKTNNPEGGEWPWETGYGDVQFFVIVDSQDWGYSYWSSVYYDVNRRENLGTFLINIPDNLKDFGITIGAYDYDPGWFDDPDERYDFSEELGVGNLKISYTAPAELVIQIDGSKDGSEKDYDVLMVLSIHVGPI